jgi:DNA-binding winged helix-turn-helix (wHTH) protein
VGEFPELVIPMRQQLGTKTLRVGRFLLDPSRQTVRAGEMELTLRPKAFNVLHYLARNMGRLVSKQELHDAIWPGVTVTDDALVQCIRELRRALADREHSLIKTVFRRGYLLDAPPKRRIAPSGPGSAPSPSTKSVGPQNSTLLSEPVPLAFTPATLPASAVSKLYSKSDAERVEAIARSKQLPIPTIQFGTPDRKVPPAIRRFVGVWVSPSGFMNTNRQFMFIVSRVEKPGLAGGYTVRGPPAPNSRIQNPAAAVPFTAFISDGVLAYSNPRGHYSVWFVDGCGLVFKQTYVTGDMTMVALEPVWTLTSAERSATSRVRRG